jgi:CubicO group peptidase (beta-lactamase class C family)
MRIKFMKKPLIKPILVFVLLFWLLSFQITFAQIKPITASQIDALVQRTLVTFDVPGIAVAVVKDGKVIHAKGYGVRSLRTREKVDENTLFGIASNTKAFTAAALGILMDEGKLTWDDKVIDYIPEFRMYNGYVTESLPSAICSPTAAAWD